MGLSALPCYPTGAGRKGSKVTSVLPVYSRRKGRERAAGPAMCRGCGGEARGGPREQRGGRVVMVVVHCRWPGPLCFQGRGSSKLQVLVGERQKAICEICVPTGSVTA